MLDMISDHIAIRCVWQFAYRSGYCIMDLTFILMLLAQRCWQGKRGFVLASADVPGAFDKVKHVKISNTLMSRGVHASIAAWFIRHIRAVRHRLRLRHLQARIEAITVAIP